MTDPLLFSNHPSDSRVTGPETVAETLNARMGTGGGNTPIVMNKIQGGQDNRLWIRSKNGVVKMQYTDKANTLVATEYKEPTMVFVMDRASYNQGKNAQYPPQIYEGGGSTVLDSKRAVCGML